MRVGCTLAGSLLTIALLISVPVTAVAQTIPPGAPEAPAVDPGRAYLFAHMTKEHYGVLYYSVSLDGLHWRRINRGNPVSSDYHGHASIAQGGDGRYYLVGNQSD